MDKEIIYNAFPKILRNDVLTVISVLPFDSDGPIDTVSSRTQEISLDGELLLIPYRIYFNEPSKNYEQALSDLQRTILNCLYLRHHSGYIRQRRLNTLISKNHYFIVPYVFQLLGEYIVEIINDIDSFVDGTNIHLFKRFLSENKGYSALTKDRMISYWNEYYRFGENKNIRNYIGKRIIDRLEKG
jgi:hypothetical protein